MTKSPRFFGYVYFFIATAIVQYAILQNSRTEGWDLITIFLMAVAPINYMMSFKSFAIAAKNKDKKK